MGKPYRLLDADSPAAERRMIMSIDYPCVNWDKGKCEKFSDDKVTSWCVEGSCDSQTPSNADKIRSMSDYELAQMLATGKWTFTCFKCPEFIDGECSMKCVERCLEWLQQPAE